MSKSKLTLQEFHSNDSTSSNYPHRVYTILVENNDDDSADHEEEKDHNSLSITWKTIHHTSAKVADSGSLVSDESMSSRNGYYRMMKSVLSIHSANLRYRTKRALCDLFLPVGYPNSVREGYLEYQFYDSLQGLCSYLRGVVSTSAVLTAAGVGDSETTALSAAVQWATRDGLGMIGGLLFSYYASSHFDSHVKEFRLFADIINDVGLTMDMLAPHVNKGKQLLFISSCATLCRSMCGMAAGATKGSITQHFAKHNMADLNAKEGTQETLVSLIGMTCGIVLARYLRQLEDYETQNPTSVDDDGEMTSYFFLFRSKATMASWIIFIVLTIVHVWANYIGVKILRLRTLNRERAEVALEEIISVSVVAVQNLKDTRSPSEGLESIMKKPITQARALSPDECCESIIRSTQKLIFPFWGSSGRIRLGVRLNEALCGTNMSFNKFQTICRNFKDDDYLLTIKDSFLSKREIIIALRIGCTDDGLLKAFVHSMIVNRYLRSRTKRGKGFISDEEWEKQAISKSKQCVDFAFTSGVLSMAKLTSLGWEKKLYFDCGNCKLQWGEEKSK